MLVAAADELEDQVGGACVVGEVSELIDDEQRRPRVVAQAAFESAAGLLSVEVEQQVGGGGEEGGVSGEDGLVGNVLRQHPSFPRPCAPTRITFSPRARKSRVRMRSRGETVQRVVGHSQFQSASGLKRPRRARVSRLSTLRRCLSSSSSATTMFEQDGGAPAFAGGLGDAVVQLVGGAVEGRGAGGQSPASSRAVLSEGIVGLQVMGTGHRGLASPGRSGSVSPQRGFESALSASGFEDVGDGAGAEGVAFEGECDGGGQLLLPVVVEQGEQPGGVRAQRLSPFGETLEERGGGGDGGAEAVAGGVGVWLGGWRRAGFPDGRGPRRSVRCRRCGDGWSARSVRRGCGCGWRRLPG